MTADCLAADLFVLSRKGLVAGKGGWREKKKKRDSVRHHYLTGTQC
jgi:hypothetical protein